MTLLPDSVDDTRALLANGNYIADRSLATALFLALRLRRPLLLEGEAGVGEGGGSGFGNLAEGFPNQLGAWVPGAAPSVSDEGVALRIEAGSTIVMQIHYSVVGGEATVDADTRLELMLTDDPPELLRASTPLALRDLDIPAGEPFAEHVGRFTYHGAEPREIRGLAGHMHLLGQQISLHVDRADGARECGLDIPDWDFWWQSSYELLPGDALMLHDGDEVELRCVYDNSAANQPVVDGAQIAPRDVGWGDGTLDEMCLLYTSTVAPFTPPKPAPIGDRYVCSGCGYEYVPELGDADGEIAPGTLFEQLPAEWVCTECAETKDQFVKA